ncbi:MAG: putative metal-binding motif-containing protein [Alphaproteobacteria bacterium]|nr:putative metal-binding motif-containing protein [Alphaproteobacteria bacterium]
MTALFLLTLACAEPGPTKEEPPTEEVCDGLDDDGDGRVDEDAPPPEGLFRDDDGDGRGDWTRPVRTCPPPEGAVRDASDCDDADPLAWLGADERCDGSDDDCDGAVDEAASDAPLWYADADGDGFGDPNDPATACAPPSGYVEDASDCDDTRSDVFPGADETPGDEVDNNCDGLLDDLEHLEGAQRFAYGLGAYGARECVLWWSLSGHPAASEACADCLFVFEVEMTFQADDSYVGGGCFGMASDLTRTWGYHPDWNGRSALLDIDPQGEVTLWADAVYDLSAQRLTWSLGEEDVRYARDYFGTLFYEGDASVY